MEAIMLMHSAKLLQIRGVDPDGIQEKLYYNSQSVPSSHVINT
jgi:hypothetical protein